LLSDANRDSLLCARLLATPGAARNFFILPQFESILLPMIVYRFDDMLPLRGWKDDLLGQTEAEGNLPLEYAG
jgi:hypothetical protein